MALSIAQSLPYFLERAKTQTISAPLYTAGALVAPTQAGSTVSVFDESGTAIVSAAAVTVTGSIATYQISAATLPATLSLSSRWRVRWSLIVSGEAHTFEVEAHLCRTVWYPTIVESDITTDSHPELASLRPSGATSWASHIDAAGEDIQRMLLADERRPYLVLSQWSLWEPHRLKALTRIFRALSVQTGPGSRYDALANQYAEDFRTAWAGLKFAYDYDADGLKGGGDEQSVAAVPVVYLHASRGA